MRLYQAGASGEAVLDIQLRLSRLGFAVASDPEGDFGSGTAAAVRQFQSERGLPVDGIVGPETWRSLVESGYGLGDRLLYYRLPMMRGSDVAELQRRLNALGFESGKVDGIFGPDTLRALLDFQRNRGMAEDGIAGPAVAHELELVARATAKKGRDSLREHEWLRALTSIAGSRVFIDPFCGDEEESAETWAAALACAFDLQEKGAIPVFSRSEDTRPNDRIRARRANRLGVDVIIGFGRAADEPAVFFFQSEYSRSEVGEELARRVGARLGVVAIGRSLPLLRETRAVAVLAVLSHLGPEDGRQVARGVEEVFSPPE